MFDSLIFSLYGKHKANKLSDDQFHDILGLWAIRVVNILAKGKSITEVYVDIENRLDRPINILIPHGTYFVAQGNHQNMVTRKEYLLKIKPNGTRFINVPATCINAGREIPSSKDSFRGVKKVPDHVKRFLKETDGCDPMIIQAGVWYLTDNLSREEIKSRLTTREMTGGHYSGISDYDIDNAQRVLERLGIHSKL